MAEAASGHAASPWYRTFKADYAGTPASTMVSAILLITTAYLLWRLFGWGVLDAHFGRHDIDACARSSGACWSVIALRWRIILFGLYPFEEHWRAALGCIVALSTVGLACVPWFWGAARMAAVWVAGYGLFYVLMHGGFFGLFTVAPSNWGGPDADAVYLCVRDCIRPAAVDHDRPVSPRRQWPPCTGPW